MENTKLGSKGEEMPRHLVVCRRFLAHLARFRYVSYMTFAADRTVLPAVTPTTSEAQWVGNQQRQVRLLYILGI